jgi:hypothetical protein
MNSKNPIMMSGISGFKNGLGEIKITYRKKLILDDKGKVVIALEKDMEIVQILNNDVDTINHGISLSGEEPAEEGDVTTGNPMNAVFEESLESESLQASLESDPINKAAVASTPDGIIEEGVEFSCDKSDDKRGLGVIQITYRKKQIPDDKGKVVIALENDIEIIQIVSNDVEVPWGNNTVSHGISLSGEKPVKEGEVTTSNPVNAVFEETLESESIHAGSESNPINKAAVVSTQYDAPEEVLEYNFNFKEKNQMESIEGSGFQSDVIATATGNTEMDRNVVDIKTVESKEIIQIVSNDVEVPWGHDTAGHGNSLSGRKHAKEGDVTTSNPMNAVFEGTSESEFIQAGSEGDPINKAAVVSTQDGIIEGGEGMESSFDGKKMSQTESIENGSFLSDVIANATGNTKLDATVEDIKIVKNKEFLSSNISELHSFFTPSEKDLEFEITPISETAVVSLEKSTVEDIKIVKNKEFLSSNISDLHSFFTPSEKDLEFEITPISETAVASLEKYVSTSDVTLIFDTMYQDTLKTALMEIDKNKIEVDRTYNVLKDPKLANKTSARVANSSSRMSNWSCACVEC